MRIAVFGTGGVGGYFGAKLAQAGNDVAFITRGAHLAALRRDGLRIESAGGDLALRNVAATDDPPSLAPVDVVMLCVKLWDVESAAAQVASLLGRDGVVIAFQNGIDSAQILSRVVGDAHVLGGVAYIAAAIRAPGVIAHTGSMAKLRVGAFDTVGALRGDGGRLRERASEFVRACTTAGIDAEVAPDIRRAIWEKFVFLTALSGVTALSRQPVGTVRSDPDLRAAFTAAMQETVALARARNVALPDDFLPKQMRAIDGLPAGMRSSMQNDLLAGRRLEAPWLCGRVAELSAAAGIAAPVNATIYAGLKPFVNGAPH
ncbi:MAG TPA: 2-dehydropantoate 2-reductase [Casimicrobiaceae bacterium]|nr:2-dehydropantoate 2-reductase [Casimicrobiaceae bacterium]